MLVKMFPSSKPKARKQQNASAMGPGAPPRLAEALLYTLDELENGSPSVYKLHMREEMRRPKDMIARQSIGKPCRIGRGEAEKVFMVVGATGAGKSTLINGMANYLLGVEWKDEFRFKLITDESKVSQAHSQTQGITAYTFHPMRGSLVPYAFTIIDTPCFGGTEGLKRDKKITEQIKELFSIPPPDGIDHLDGIGFVIQSSQARLTQTQRYIFDSILSIFGNDVSRNIFMMITFADGQRPPVLEAVKEAKIPNYSEKFFKFNNSALFAENNESGEVDFDEMFWKMGSVSFKKFFQEFPKAESVSLRLTKEVLKEREELHVLVEGLNIQITVGLNKLEEIRQEEIVIQQREKEIETNKDFTYNVDLVKPFHISLEGTGRHTTTCGPCHKTCHSNCRIIDDANKFYCWAMNEEGRCRICPRNCLWSEHKNLPYLIEYRTVTETRTAEDLKKKYHKAVKEKATSEQMMRAIEVSLQKVHVEVLTMIKRAQQSLRRLDEIALKPNPLTQVEYLELLIESEKMDAKPGWKQRVKYLEVAKRHAETLSKVKDERETQRLIKQLSRDVDVGEEQTRDFLKNLSLGQDKWYSRFKFW
ncbi:uncharacterized protein LOC111319040 [Stylophora pistillata]|nr:uncharacterized protein LOC111319040 [Stylophora pistillata]XP_022777607.1 uncharacterized protein LOC111319040 [Stylophora pistillata]